MPWRRTRDPYKILVSEVMLQQTQVERVIPYYKAFLKKFPNVRALSHAKLSEVLKIWQGLGYNRRAKMLREAAKVLAQKHNGRFPKTAEELEALPGVGPYTAHAVAAFAYNQNVVFVETNIRTAVTHHFFTSKEKTDDAEVFAVLHKTLPKGKSREWYAALMDYGAYLKRSGVRLNARSKHYAKQSVFEGSMRQARGALLKELAKSPCERTFLIKILGPSRREQVKNAVASLTQEGLIQLRGTRFRLAR